MISVKLKGFFIDGYKCLKNVYLPLDNKLCVLIGPNDSGKSSILRAIELFYRCVENGRRVRKLQWGDFNLEDDEKRILLAAVFDEIHGLCSDEYSALLVEIHCEENLSSERDYRSPVKVGIAKKPAVFNIKDKCIKEINDNQKEKVNRLLEKLPRPILLTTDRDLEETYGSRGIIGAQLRPIIDSVINEDKDAAESFKLLENKIRNKLRERFNELNDVLRDNYGFSGVFDPSVRLDVSKGVECEFVHRVGNVSIPLTEKGEGIQSIVLLELYRLEALAEGRTNEYILLIDEIENHLYPLYIHKVLSTILNLCKNNYYTLIVTHSPIIINNVAPEYIYYVHKVNNVAKIRAISDEEDLIKVNKELDVKLCDILGADVIILVEGAYDKKAISLLIDILNRDKGAATNVLIIPAEGESKIPYFAEICSRIVERYSGGRVLVILDGDASKTAKRVKRGKFTRIKVLGVYTKATIEDIIERQKAIDMVAEIIKKELSHINVDISVNEIISEIREEITEKKRGLLDAIGKALGAKVGRDLDKIKDLIKSKFWRSINTLSESDLSPLGKELLRWLSENLF